MNNINTPNTSINQSEKMEWVAPVLYKEDWINTLSGPDPTTEDSDGNLS